MDQSQFSNSVSSTLASYLADEELYDDNARLVVNPDTLVIELHDGDDDIDDALDQYFVMDLLRMDAQGVWQPDLDAVASLVAEYFR